MFFHPLSVLGSCPVPFVRMVVWSLKDRAVTGHCHQDSLEFHRKEHWCIKVHSGRCVDFLVARGEREMIKIPEGEREREREANHHDTTNSMKYFTFCLLIFSVAF